MLGGRGRSRDESGNEREDHGETARPMTRFCGRDGAIGARPGKFLGNPDGACGALGNNRDVADHVCRPCQQSSNGMTGAKACDQPSACMVLCTYCQTASHRLAFSVVVQAVGSLQPSLLDTWKEALHFFSGRAVLPCSAQFPGQQMGSRLALERGVNESLSSARAAR